MKILKEKQLWAEDQIKYAEIAAQHPDCIIPVECECGEPWEDGYSEAGCPKCGFMLPEEYRVFAAISDKDGE